jgi:hypothetical protein
MAKPTFSDPDLGKFAWDPILHAWKGSCNFATKETCALNLRGDVDGDHDPTAADLAAAMPRVKRLLGHIRDKHNAWRKRAEDDIQSEVEQSLEEGGFELDADVEAVEELALEDIDLHITAQLNVTASVRYHYAITVDSSTVEWWVEVEVNGRGQYRGALLGEL